MVWKKPVRFFLILYDLLKLPLTPVKQMFATHRNHILYCCNNNTTTLLLLLQLLYYFTTTIRSLLLYSCRTVAVFTVRWRKVKQEKLRHSVIWVRDSTVNSWLCCSLQTERCVEGKLNTKRGIEQVVFVLLYSEHLFSVNILRKHFKLEV